MINLLEETEKALKNHKTNLPHVVCIKNAEGYMTTAEFAEQAAKINYDNGYGEVQIDPTLVIIGKFWWMDRQNYDGLEGWVYHHKPKKPTVKAGDVNLRNTRMTMKSTFEEIVEKVGGYFEEE